MRYDKRNESIIFLQKDREDDITDHIYTSAILLPISNINKENNRVDLKLVLIASGLILLIYIFLKIFIKKKRSNRTVKEFPIEIKNIKPLEVILNGKK